MKDSLEGYSSGLQPYPQGRMFTKESSQPMIGCMRKLEGLHLKEKQG